MYECKTCGIVYKSKKYYDAHECMLFCEFCCLAFRTKREYKLHIETKKHKRCLELGGYHEKYDSLFVAFRGSENIENWLQNIKIEFKYSNLLSA